MVSQRKNGVQKKRVDKSGLGKAIINRRKKAAVIAADPTLHTSELVHGMNSITQENDLEEFLSTAQLADTDFSAERQNITVISSPSLPGSSNANPYLLTPAQEREIKDKQAKNRKRLQVPRRPHWSRQMTRVELEKQEREHFLNWRRALADLQDNQSLLLTPFERNLEIWRQLWRTIERSDVIVQIVDARNPLGFRCEDLERYVEEMNEGLIGEKTAEENEDEDEDDEEYESEEERETKVKFDTSAQNAETTTEYVQPATEVDNEVPKALPRAKRNLLLINKSDLLTLKQREYWADYFEANNIEYAFFSAAISTAIQEARREEEARRYALEHPDPETARDTDSESVSGEGSEGEDDEESEEQDTEEELVEETEKNLVVDDEPVEADRTRILSVLELESLFLSHAPENFSSSENERMTVGLVGYPNVGKSSTINALIGEKKVSVSSTPGKTKHFQTINLSPEVLLCDCPGLVFPQFATTKADLVCDGILPIDQMKEHTGPVELITQRIPQAVLEGLYGLKITTLPVSEGGTGVPTAREFLTTYAIARGFFTGGQGNADTSRASRVILKDLVNGKILYCHPPPNVNDEEFNAELRDLERLKSLGLLKEKMAPTTRVRLNADTFIPHAKEEGASSAQSKTKQSTRAKAIDHSFFASGLSSRPMYKGVAGAMQNSNANGDFSRVQIFAHQVRMGNDGVPIVGKTGRRLAKEAGLEAAQNGKKHFKVKRQKQRSGRGYDDM